MASNVSVVKAGYWVFGNTAERPLSEIPSQLFTHLYAGFAVVNIDTGGVTFPDQYQVQFKNFSSTVRQRSPMPVKTLLSIGGDGSDISPVVTNERNRKRFITDSIKLARSVNFDGLDLCWLYPASNANLEESLSLLLRDWRDAVNEDARTTNRDKLLLTAAVFHHPAIPCLRGGSPFEYPCQAISDNLDWINVLAIDFYAPSNSSPGTGPVHAWNNRTTDPPNKCGRVGIQNWIDKGVATQKLVLAFPFYGYQWVTYQNQNQNDIPGFFAQAPVSPENKIPMAYINIQEKLRGGIYRTVYNRNYVAAYSYSNMEGRWICYDDGICISAKVCEAIGNKKLRGYFAWPVGADDNYWSLSRAAFESWPPAINANQ